MTTLTTLNNRFGKAKSGCAAERKVVFYDLLDMEAKINSAVVSGKEPACGLWALREVRDGYIRQIKEMSK